MTSDGTVIAGIAAGVAHDTAGNASVASTMTDNVVAFSTPTHTWDGGSTVNNLWTTKENWVGNVAPLPGDNLIFPAGAAQLVNSNDYPSGTVFGSITVSGSGYHFQGSAYQASAFEVQANANVEANAIYSGTLNIAAGATLTIAALPGGPLAANSIDAVLAAPTPATNEAASAPASSGSLSNTVFDAVAMPNAIIAEIVLPVHVLETTPARLIDTAFNRIPSRSTISSRIDLTALPWTIENWLENPRAEKSIINGKKSKLASLQEKLPSHPGILEKRVYAQALFGRQAHVAALRQILAGHISMLKRISTLPNIPVLGNISSSLKKLLTQFWRKKIKSFENPAKGAVIVLDI